MIRPLYFILGALVALVTAGTEMLKHLDAVRAAHVEGVFQSYVLGCITAKDGAEGSYIDCRDAAKIHQADIIEITKGENDASK